MTLLNCCRDVSLVQGKPHQIAINDGRGFRHGHPVAMNGDPTGNMPLNDERGFRRGHPVAMNGAPTGLCTFAGCVFIRTWGCARQSVNLQPSPKPDKGWNAGPWSKASHARDGVCRAIRDETASLRSGRVFHPETAKTTDEKKPAFCKAGFLNDGRRERIRTSDPLVPNQLRYQAALLADRLLLYC
jgi:hypothetical protein